MGKLYDKRDLEFDLGVIDKLEQQTSAEILAGTFPALKASEVSRIFDEERQHCKMKRLRSTQLVADLRGALAIWRACPHCTTDAAGRQRGCKAHNLILRRAKSAIHWAAEDNLQRRINSGQQREDDAPHDGACNKWESWYFKDRREGIWPGTLAHTYNGPELDKLREQYGSLDYRGWLRFVYENEEMTHPEYASELRRLRGEDGI